MRHDGKGRKGVGWDGVDRGRESREEEDERVMGEQTSTDNLCTGVGGVL